MAAKWRRFQAHNSGVDREGELDRANPVKEGQGQQISTKSGINLQAVIPDKRVNVGYDREFGNHNMIDVIQITGQNSNVILEGNTIGINSLTIMDSQRCRTTLDRDISNKTEQANDTDMETLEGSPNGSENGVLASSVL